MTIPRPDGRLRIVVSTALVTVCLAVYGQAIGFEFVLYDDATYIVENERLQDGLSAENVFWGFTTGYFANWHPLTWLSYFLDAELFGLEPWGFHLTNVLLHTANTVLLFWWLSGATARLWPSAFVALVFAVHPLHVESVAWVSERKDVLSTFFMLITLLMYTRYVRKPSSSTYIFIELLFVCALLSKSMVVSLPLLLLLLDVWPYGRYFGPGSVRRLFEEKIPLFALAGAVALVTLLVQQRGGAITSTDSWPLVRRPLTVAAGYGAYFIQTIVPVQLSVFYPRHWDAAFWFMAGFGAVVVVVGAYTSIRLFTRRPYVFTGWFWFLIGLLPVIGIVQLGSHAHADRYMYIPLIGPAIIAAWAIADAVASQPRWRPVAPVACGAVAIALSWLSYEQAGHWKNSEALFRHALAASGDSAFSHWALAKALAESGQSDEALIHFDRALELSPEHELLIYSKSEFLKSQGEFDQAEAGVLRILDKLPGHVPSLELLGEIYIESGKHDDAITAFGKVLEHEPEHTVARGKLIQLLESAGRADEADSYRKTVDRPGTDDTDP